MVKITETKVKGGMDIKLTCEVSGMPLVRANMYGMFCEQSPCVCEEKSKEFAPVLQALIGEFGKP